MPTTLFTEFFPYVEPDAPGCPTSVMQAKLAEAAAVFCKSTYLWRVDLTGITTEAGTQDYAITVPSGTVIEDIVSPELDGRAINRVSDKKAPPSVSDEEGTPQWFGVYQDTKVRFFPTPNAALVFKGTAVLKPALTATGVETFLYETFGRCIANGALARILGTPGKAWSDVPSSSIYEHRFKQAMDNARIRDNRSVHQSVVMRPFA